MKKEIKFRLKKSHDTIINLTNDELEQYTGLKDKNGKDIYEGDIVRIYREHTLPKSTFVEDYKYVVKWKLNGWYPFADSPENCGHCGGAENVEDCEVIGNINDNPELKEDCK